MKYSLLILLFIQTLVSASEIDDAEKLLKQGRLAQCGKIISQLEKREGLTKEERQKIFALREYLIGENPKARKDAIKKARKLSRKYDQTIEDIVNRASAIIRRAYDWKNRGFLEYQELSMCATELLKKGKDDGDANTTIKLVILKVKNFNLNGMYQNSIELIKATMLHYYPTSQYSGTRQLQGSAQLLALLGEQYIGSFVF